MAECDFHTDCDTLEHRPQIRAGDTVTVAWAPSEATVEHVSGEYAWLFFPGGNPDGVLVRVSALTKVEPRFQVGKTYRSNGGVVTVIGVNDTWATGWFQDGSPWSRPHTSNDVWTEAAE